MYRIEFPNGKAYIGITRRSVSERLAEHRLNVNDPSKRSLALYRAIVKHGLDQAKVTTLLISDEWAYLCAMEVKAIVAYGTRSPYGYNLSDGGDGSVGFVLSDESRSRMAQAQRDLWLLPEHRQKMTASRTGRKQSSETRARRSESVKAVWSDPQYREMVRASHRVAWARRRARSSQGESA